MSYRCAICDHTYLLWSDGLHHDDRRIDHWHEPEIGDLRPIVDERQLPPWMRLRQEAPK